MPAKAVYASGVLGIYVSGEELDDMIRSTYIRTPLSLKGVEFPNTSIHVDLIGDTCDVLGDLVKLERSAMERERTAVMRANPGYSNRKIRKGKGHGKG